MDETEKRAALAANISRQMAIQMREVCQEMTRITLQANGMDWEFSPILGDLALFQACCISIGGTLAAAVGVGEAYVLTYSKVFNAAVNEALQAAQQTIKGMEVETPVTTVSMLIETARAVKKSGDE